MQSFFPDADEAKREAMLTRLLTTSPDKKLVRTAGLRDALNILQETADGEKFQDLLEKVAADDREHLIRSRVGAPHEKAQQWTPQCLRDLKPEGAVFCYQASARCFEGYYPVPPEKRTGRLKNKKHWTIARTHGEKWTPLSALTQVIAQLWKWHQQEGGDAWS